MVATLRYVDRLEFEPDSTTTKVWSFRANGAFDPLANVGGHQPRGFDEYSSLYSTYTVTASKVTVNWMYDGYNGPSMTGGTPAILTQQVEGDASDVPSLSPAICGIFKANEAWGADMTNSELMERDRVNWTVLTPNANARSTSQKSTFTEFFGKQDLVAAEGYSGNTGGIGTGTDPDNQVYYHLWASRGSEDYPNGKCRVTAFVNIEYRVVFTDPKPLDAS